MGWSYARQTTTVSSLSSSTHASNTAIPSDWGLAWKGKVQPHIGVNQGALAGPSAMVLRLVCVCVRAVPRAPCPVCMRALRVSCPSLSVLVLLRSRQHHCVLTAVRCAIDALGQCDQRGFR
jgi:hypothetical protein